MISRHAARSRAVSPWRRSSSARVSCVTSKRMTPSAAGAAVGGAGVGIESPIERRVLHQLLEPRVSRATHRELLAVGEDRHAAVLGIELEPLQALHVEHVRAMDANEARGIGAGGDF